MNRSLKKISSPQLIGKTFQQRPEDIYNNRIEIGKFPTKSATTLTNTENTHRKIVRTQSALILTRMTPKTTRKGKINLNSKKPTLNNEQIKSVYYSRTSKPNEVLNISMKSMLEKSNS